MLPHAKRRKAKPKAPEFDYPPPPSHPVVWVIVDEQDAGNVAEGFAQTAYKAFELSGICRNGQRLSFSQIRASISQSKTEQVWLCMLLEFLITVSRPQKLMKQARTTSKPKFTSKNQYEKYRAKLNGHAKKKGT